MFKGILKEEKEIFYVELEEGYASFLKEFLDKFHEEECIIDLKGPENTPEFSLSYVNVFKFTDEELENRFKELNVKFRNFKTMIGVKDIEIFLKKLGYGTGIFDVFIISKNMLIRIDHDEYIAILPKQGKRSEVKKILSKIISQVD